MPRLAVLGTYSSAARAAQAKEDYLEDGGWEEGAEGYHQGCEEVAIEIIASRLDAGPN